MECTRGAGGWPRCMKRAPFPTPRHAQLEWDLLSYDWDLQGVGGHPGDGRTGQQQEGRWPHTGPSVWMPGCRRDRQQSGQGMDKERLEGQMRSGEGCGPQKSELPVQGGAAALTQWRTGSLTLFTGPL